uniref:KRAB domain-containing protein n=1 Tax=Marmota marmota marmota TaxID=9994 RepID=A0A8C5ZAZ6_MARMA
MCIAVSGTMRNRGHIVSEDVAIYFSQEEWELINEAQRYLYHDEMLQNFAHLSSLGCWHGAVDEEAPYEQDVFVGISTQKPCEMCSSPLEDTLYLTEYSGTHPEHECGRALPALTAAAESKSFQK